MMGNADDICVEQDKICLVARSAINLPYQGSCFTGSISNLNMLFQP